MRNKENVTLLKEYRRLTTDPKYTQKGLSTEDSNKRKSEFYDKLDAINAKIIQLGKTSK